MVSVQSLAEMRVEGLARARMTGDTTFQGFFDRWLNQALADLCEKYTFPEQVVRWAGPLSDVAPRPHTWAPYEVNLVPRDIMVLLEAHILDTSPQTNLIVSPDDLTSSDWTATTMTTAATSTGPDDTANAATRLTASAGNATVLQAITSSFARRETSVWIRRITGTGNIQMTQDNGTTWTTLVLSAEWTYVSIASVASANPTVGIRIVTNADAVDVIEFRHEVVINTSSLSKHRLQVLPQLEFDRLISSVNPPKSGRPSAVCLRRREGTREHLFDPRTAETGIRVTSTASETTLTCAVTYYADANRIDTRKAITSTEITTTATVLVTANHYGIVSVSISANALGRITIDNTAGTRVYALLYPWEREATYPVLGFNSLPTVMTDKLHLTYKRWAQYLSQAADVMHGIPVEAQQVVFQRAVARALRHQQDGTWKDELAAAQLAERELWAYRPGELEEPHIVMDDYD